MDNPPRGKEEPAFELRRLKRHASVDDLEAAMKDLYDFAVKKAGNGMDEGGEVLTRDVVSGVVLVEFFYGDAEIMHLPDDLSWDEVRDRFCECVRERTRGFVPETSYFRQGRRAATSARASAEETPGEQRRAS